jgi:hypothetical protein
MTERPQAASRTTTKANGKKNDNLGKRLGRAVDRSTARVERWHRTVAGVPLDALENVHRLEAPVARLRKLQTRRITATYEFVRGLNHEVALLAKEVSRDMPGRRSVGRVEKAKARRHDPPEVVATAS